MNKQKKVCPLMCIAGNGGTCVEERCAWWSWPGCAVVSIAESLEDLAQEGSNRE